MEDASRTPEIHFDNLLNFRDVGAHINGIAGSEVLKSGLLFRSARPDEISPSDRLHLVKTCKIKTIIDLRSKTEHINAAKKRSGVSSISESAAIPSPTDAIPEQIKIPGIQYAEINLNGKGFERHLIWQLKYASLAKLVFLMALGYRTEGISVIGKELMLPRGLTGLGIDTLDHSGPEIKEVFDVLSEPTRWPVLVHCTQGKDRTGLVVLLVLLLCNIDIEAISRDYVKSEPELEPEKEERMKEITSIGLDESFAGCPPDFCEKVLQHLDSTYGSLESYLDRIGVGSEQRARVQTGFMNKL
ncbi:hypothetical protein A1O1_01113 [Capronia coronata CBS 617.96]|uniref:Tyrosine specific protein phosphatases domain-containing protein n=1 Tax=Capronia coronata CBS 617.96 TaxID=1182541 RepID=W9YSW6_9EURO|nr:uncharacterized protein A1O1_01113 [Capronia coronata CBS 617.96]EXJ95987.1 hypothetical protein A1O1_01113 [Capronia coronata CBS 617.96]